jgi:putative endonuclease
MRRYFVYILSNFSGTLYTGVTNDLERRLGEHREGAGGGFTSKYNVKWLVYCEETNDIREAIAREREIKGWRREKKVALIESVNPDWQDLSTEDPARGC